MFKTLEEANEARLDLVDRIQAIEAQLSERSAQVSVGRVPDEQYREYLVWKAKASFAKAQMVSKLGRVKAEIRSLRKVDIQERIAKRGGGEGLLNDLYSVTKTMVADGVEITPEEQHLLDTVQQYLEEA
jgi:hypothetical protein